MTAATLTGPAAEVRTRRPSLLAAELHRMTARRFVRLLVILGALGYLVALVIATTQFSKPNQAILDDARTKQAQVLAEQEAARQQCLANPPSPLPPGVSSAEELCGPPLTADQLPVEQFIGKAPFALATEYSNGALGVAAGSAAVMFLIGATYVGAEWSTKTMTALLFWEPRRLKVVGTKALVVAVTSAVLAVLAQVVWAGAARFLAATRGVTDVPDGWLGQVLGVQARGVLLVVLVALLGFGLANLIRNTGAALGVAFVWFAVLENLVRAVRPAWQQWLVSDNVGALVSPGGITIGYPGTAVDANGNVQNFVEVHLSNLHGGLVLGAVTAAVLAVGTVLFRRRDLQ